MRWRVVSWDCKRARSAKRSRVVFNGSTFAGAAIQARTLTLHNIVLYPELMAQLARHTQLEYIDLKVSLESAEQHHGVAHGFEIEVITPLPHLCRVDIGGVPVGNSLLPKSLLTPTARSIVSAVAQLARNASSIFVQLAPLRAADIASCDVSSTPAKLAPLLRLS